MLAKNILAALAVTLLSAATFGQGARDLVGGVNKGVQGHNEAIEDAMNDKPKSAPASAPAAPEAKNGWIQKKLADGSTARFYFAHPPIAAGSKPNLPALIVIQEWWGLNDDIQERTREFAAKGYYAVAVDLYDGKSTADPKEAAELKGKMTDAAALMRLKAGVDLLTDEAKNGAVDPKKIASIGWCMGGEQSLKLSVADSRIKYTVLFYGNPVLDPEKLKNLQGPVLGVFGQEDKGIPPATVDKLDKALVDLKIKHEIYNYPGVGHAFASKSAKATGMYNEEKAAEAWKITYAWLEKNVKGTK
jgi:carboxymethylenebutenolidase